jgi:hypothetical protein
MASICYANPAIEHVYFVLVFMIMSVYHVKIIVPFLEHNANAILVRINELKNYI